MACSTTSPARRARSSIFNAGVALYAANLVDTIGDGILRAREIIESGAARAKLDEFVRFTQQFRSGR